MADILDKTNQMNPPKPEIPGIGGSSVPPLPQQAPPPSFDSLVGTGSSEPTVIAAPPAEPTSSTPPSTHTVKKGGSKKTMILGIGLLLLLGVMSISMYFLNQSKQVADLRSKATGNECTTGVTVGQTACNPSFPNKQFVCEDPTRAYPWRDVDCPAGQTCQGTSCQRTNNGSSCAGAGQSCESQSCCDGQGLYCTGVFGQRKCERPSATDTGTQCPGSTCTRILAFHCGNITNGKCENNPAIKQSWDEGVAYAAGCGQVDMVCAGGSRENQLCGNFTVYNNQCGTGGNNNPTATPTRRPTNTSTPTHRPTATPTPIPACGENCSNNNSCPTGLTCESGKCILSACAESGAQCDDTKCSLLPTPTPTPIIGQCRDIKIYKNGSVVIPSSLSPGDSIVIAVVGTNATKARIKINGGAFTETVSKNDAGEFIMSYTVPSSGTLNFTIEAEVYVGNSWQ